MLRSRPLLTGLLFAAGCLLAAPGAHAGAISGVCPDGSIFIVQQPESIPCRDAKRVDPGDVPPLNPEFLPRPYGWDVFNRETDPNNPYNLIDGGVRPPGTDAAATPVAPPPPAPTGTTPLQGMPPTPAVAGAPPRPTTAVPSGPALRLAATEVEDLAAIIEVLQGLAPATLVPRDAEAAGIRLRFARSAAFESRVHQALAARGAATGPVVAFHVVAEAPGAFHGHLTFVQGHMAFHPNPANPDQLGLVDGRLGALEAGDRVIGYAVLPDGTDLREPIDVYWDDRRLTATLAPEG